MKYLAMLRKRRGLTQAELAERVGVSSNTIPRYERGELTPSIKIAHAIAEVLGCTETELLNGPADSKIKITLTWNREDVEGEIDMNGNSFALFLGTDGTIGIKGGAKFTTREGLKEVIAAIAKELEEGYEFQLQRGRLKEN